MPTGRENLSDRLRHALETELSEHAFNTWIKPVVFAENLDGSEILLQVPNRFYRERLSQHYTSVIQGLLVELEPNQKWTIRVETQSSAESKSAAPSGPEKASVPASGSESKGRSAGINPRYRFESFVVGDNSQFAYAACQAVAEGPGRTYNPLFVYGGVGLGKTHLLGAIGNAILEKRPQTRIVYRSSEQFMNELINSIRYEKMQTFRDRHRKSCDVLLIDDVQFFSGKERTQEEFFHTFNALYQTGKQIVLSSDQPPHTISDVDERLRSRFEAGLTCDIQPPDVETRMAILFKRANEENVELSDAVASILAERFATNVRVLEGALIRLLAHASLTQRAIDADLAQDVFGQTEERHQEALTVENILEAVAKFFNISVVDLKSARRQKFIAQPRQIAMFLARKHTPLSFPEIGQRFGGKDHTTIMHGVSKIQKLLNSDGQLQKQIQTLQDDYLLNP